LRFETTNEFSASLSQQLWLDVNCCCRATRGMVTFLTMPSELRNCCKYSFRLLNNKHPSRTSRFKMHSTYQDNHTSWLIHHVNISVHRRPFESRCSSPCLEGSDVLGTCKYVLPFITFARKSF
jgi:hypothetical protein